MWNLKFLQPIFRYGAWRLTMFQAWLGEEGREGAGLVSWEADDRGHQQPPRTLKWGGPTSYVDVERTQQLAPG